MLNEFRVFLEALHKDILWRAGWALLGIAVGWQSAYLRQVLPRLLEFERKAVEFHGYANEGQKVERVYDAVGAAIKAAKAAATQYNATFNQHGLNKPISQEAIARGLEAITRSRREFADAYAMLRGTQFDIGNLEAYRHGFEQDLATLDLLDGQIETIFSTREQGDPRAHASAVAAFRSDYASLEGVEPTLLTLLSRLDSFNQEAHLLQEGWRIDVVEGIVRERMSEVDQAIFGLALVYEIGFALVGSRAWRKRKVN